MSAEATTKDSEPSDRVPTEAGPEEIVCEVCQRSDHHPECPVAGNGRMEVQHEDEDRVQVELVSRTPEDPFQTDQLNLVDGSEATVFKVKGSRPLGDPSPDLIQKVCEARKNIDTVPKSGENERIDHEYSTYDDVNGTIAEPLAEAGVWVHSSIVDTFKQPSGTTSHGNQRYCVTAVMEVYLTDGDSRIGRRVVGENENAGDKHHYALESQLLRYALSKMLLLESGDPEVDQDPNSGQGAPKASSHGSSEKSGDGEPATDSQTSTLREISKEARKAGADLSDLPGLDDLTKDEASDLFDILKKRKREARKKQAQERAGQQTIKSGEDDDGS